MVQNEQRHDLVGEERSDDLSGQPGGEGVLSDLLDKVTGKKKQQLISDQQDGEGYDQHVHAHPLVRGYLRGQRALERGVDPPKSSPALSLIEENAFSKQTLAQLEARRSPRIR
jgi:hypothetical protein